MTNYLSPEQVLFIHMRLIEETGGAHGVRDIPLLLSALGRPQATYDGKDLYPEIFEKAAALIDSLIRNHPFVDGNKRTGIAAGGIFLRLNGFLLTASNAELEEFTLKIARAQVEMKEIKTWISEHNKTLDSP